MRVKVYTAEPRLWESNRPIHISWLLKLVERRDGKGHWGRKLGKEMHMQVEYRNKSRRPRKWVGR